MGLTVVPGSMIEDGTVTDSNFTNTTITSTDMAVDPRNASNMSSGSVPLAQLGNVDLTGLEDDTALLGFKAAANGSLVKYNLLDQTVDAFEDASGVDAGSSTNEVRDASKYYSGTAAASGGTITTHGSYTVHSFTDTGNTNFVVGAAGNVAVLVVAGGGGAGTFSGGGGGAGGFRTSASHAVTAQTYTVTVGAGGAGGTRGTPSGYTIGTNGGNSVFDTITSAGGGGGMGYASNVPGAAGGSGGGSGTNGQGYPTGSGGAGNTPSTSPSQGNAGGDGRSRDWPGAPNVNYYGGGGGGGGAGGAGVDSCNMPNCGYGGNGGAGSTNDYRTGSNVTYAGGGSGAGGESHPYGSPGPNGTGGSGGGGQSQAYNASYAGAYVPAAYGTANTGGGGGGGVRDNWGGYGGSGIVVVRYTTGDLSTYENMTLVSTATTAQAVPTKGDMVLTYTNGAGTAVINTNIKGYVSRDGGTTYTEGTLVSQGTTGGHTIASFHDLDISAQPSGSSMRYKIETLVQSASMQTRIQAVSLGWS